MLNDSTHNLENKMEKQKKEVEQAEQNLRLEAKELGITFEQLLKRKHKENLSSSKHKAWVEYMHTT